MKRRVKTIFDSPLERNLVQQHKMTIMENKDRIRELDFFTHKGVTYLCRARVGEMVIFNNEMVHESECVRHTEPFKLSFETMKTGAQMISKERADQWRKHKFSEIADDEYVNGELKQAALFALTINDDTPLPYPKYWADWFADKCSRKSEIQLLTVAGALLAAEIDRLKRMEERDANVI